MASPRSHDGPAVLLRRQVYYCLTWAERPDAGAWLARAAQAEERRLGDTAGWSPAWAALRSLQVSRARTGDPEPLRHFIRTSLASEQCLAANLTYWAYWVGEIGGVRHGDDFMVTETMDGWRGVLLMQRLLGTMTPGEPLIDLYVHSVWSLVRRRAAILKDDPRLAERLLERVEGLLDDSAAVSPSARAQLEQLRFTAGAVQPWIAT